jgi:hypothetical protein
MTLSLLSPEALPFGTFLVAQPVSVLVRLPLTAAFLDRFTGLTPPTPERRDPLEFLDDRHGRASHCYSPNVRRILLLITAEEVHFSRSSDEGRMTNFE